MRIRALLLTLAAMLLSGCAFINRTRDADRTVLFASVGPDLSWYDIGATDAKLARRGTVTLPAIVQYAWASPSRRFLYVAWSDVIPGTGNGTRHGVSAFAIDPATGALTEHGAAVSLRSRPIHITVDVTGTHVLVAHNDPSGVTVFALTANGSIGAEVAPPAPLDMGVFAHQVRVDPSNRRVYVVTRGIAPTATAPEQPGAIKVLDYADGVLTKNRSVAPRGGFGFQSRNIDFHPTRPWVYLVLERQNALQLFSRRDNGQIPDGANASAGTLDAPDAATAAQVAAAVAVHPNGRFAYVANRASSTRDHGGVPVFAGGENSIAVFSLDPATGVPTRIGNEPTRGFSPRTFSLDARGSMLAVGNSVALNVVARDGIRTVPASIVLFDIGANGRLSYASKLDVETTPQRALIWVGFVALP